MCFKHYQKIEWEVSQIPWLLGSKYILRNNILGCDNSELPRKRKVSLRKYEHKDGNNHHLKVH